jgi:predicted RNase H-like HicB family nuclease
MQETTTIRIRVVRGDDQYLGECLDYPVMTHGRSLEELAENMEKALHLFLSGEGREEGDEFREGESVMAIRVELPGPGR